MNYMAFSISGQSPNLLKTLSGNSCLLCQRNIFATGPRCWDSPAITNLSSLLLFGSGWSVYITDLILPSWNYTTFCTFSKCCNMCKFPSLSPIIDISVNTVCLDMSWSLDTLSCHPRHVAINLGSRNVHLLNTGTNTPSLFSDMQVTDSIWPFGLYCS